MNKKKNIIVVDDIGDLMKSLVKTFNGDEEIQLIQTSSILNEVDDKLELENYLVIINEGDLKTDIRTLVSHLYYRSQYIITPFIIVTDKKFNLSDEEQKLMPVISVISKNFNLRRLRHHLTNILESIESNRNLNALSGLPGNYVINRKLQDCINSGKDFALMYIDLDNFKEYNEYYGFYKGDQVLLFLTKILYEVMGECGAETDFIGHVGGDDFVMILEHTNVLQEIGRRIITAFDSKISDFYEAEDLKNKYIETKNRAGQIERINIMSISIVVIYAQEFRTTKPEDIYKKMMLYKKQAKMKKGSTLVDTKK